MHTPEITFVCGAALVALVLYYLGTQRSLNKKISGTLLTVGITAFCLWALLGLGIKKGIDLGGGSSFTVQLSPATLEDGSTKQLTAESVQQAIGILEKRLNPNGENDLLLAPQGTDRILVQMPGSTPEQVAEVRKTIEMTAHLEFRLVHPDSTQQLITSKLQNIPVIGYVEMPGVDGATNEPINRYLVSSRVDLDGTHVKKAYAYPDPIKGWTITMEFDSEGAQIFSDLTGNNVNRNLAIIVDGVVLSAPGINERIPNGSAVISGNYKEADARNLAVSLENPLENPMKIIEESTVSAAFGEQTIKQGVMTGWVSAVLIALFMLIYYRFAGLIALVGLAICMLVTLGAMALFNFTLTMPGIAGLVLTMGMAVDANVLIYERLREEMANGKGIASALESAFSKAFSAIFDSNITTLISAVVLFYLASGQVKGFAVTLTVGIFGTLLGALVVTRICFSWLIDAGILKKLTVAHLIPDRTYDMLKAAKFFFFLSIVLFAGILGFFAIKGKDTVGIDFRGGALTRFEIKEGQRVEIQQIEDLLAEAGILGTYVQESTTATNELITVRSEYDDGTRVKDLVEAKFSDVISGGQVERIGSVVGKELAVRSSIAFAVAIVGMLIYLTIFYEWAFAFAALVSLLHDCVLAIGISVLLGQQLSAIHIGALLTVAGYSLNDTIIVFDRIREMLRKGVSSNLREVINIAVSSTLSRTLLTSTTVLMAMVVLMIAGGPAMKEFALPILIGVVVGTYSSIYIASAVLIWYVKFSGKNLALQVLETETRREALNAEAAGV